MSAITTHVLDTAAGRPARNVAVTLEQLDAADAWRLIAEGRTDDNGRIGDLLAPERPFEAGTYRLRFDVGAYFAAQDRDTFYPYAEIVFRCADASQHYHVPLLLTPFGYSTYRGS